MIHAAHRLSHSEVKGLIAGTEPATQRFDEPCLPLLFFTGLLQSQIDLYIIAISPDCALNYF